MSDNAKLPDDAIPTLDILAPIGDKLVECAKNGYVKVGSTCYSSYKLLQTLSQSPDTNEIWNDLGMAAGGAALTYLAIAAGGPVVWIAGAITGGVLSVGRNSLVLIVNRLDQPLTLSKSYTAYGSQERHAVTIYHNPQTQVPILGPSNIIPAAKTDPKGNKTYGVGMYLYVKNTFLGLGGYGNEGVLAFGSPSASISGDFALSWSNPYGAGTHGAVCFDYKHQYSDLEQMYETTTGNGKSIQSATQGTTSAWISAQQLNLAEPKVRPLEQNDQKAIVFTVAVG